MNFDFDVPTLAGRDCRRPLRGRECDSQLAAAGLRVVRRPDCLEIVREETMINHVLNYMKSNGLRSLWTTTSALTIGAKWPAYAGCETSTPRTTRKSSNLSKKGY
jgi:hypothetical protein